MKLRKLDCLKAAILGVALLITAVPASAQTTSTGEIKKSGSEAKKAGTSLGSNVRHGRVFVAANILASTSEARENILVAAPRRCLRRYSNPRPLRTICHYRT